jgi:hypothetical protein
MNLRTKVVLDDENNVVTFECVVLFVVLFICWNCFVWLFTSLNMIGESLLL